MVNRKVFTLNEVMAVLWIGLMIGMFIGSYAMVVVI